MGGLGSFGLKERVFHLDGAYHLGKAIGFFKLLINNIDKRWLEICSIGP
jgi:hypothetical protein